MDFGVRNGDNNVARGMTQHADVIRAGVCVWQTTHISQQPNQRGYTHHTEK